MRDTTLLISFAVITLVAFFTLGYFIDRHSLDPDYQKNWWSIAFTDPKDDSLDFTIANHSDQTMFTYTITRNKQEITRNTLDIPKGISSAIPIDMKVADNRTTITVWTDEKDKREIYK